MYFFICFYVPVIPPSKIRLNTVKPVLVVGGSRIYVETGMLVSSCMLWIYSSFHSPGKGEDKEYPTIGARLIRLEDKVGTLLALRVCFVCKSER